MAGTDFTTKSVPQGDILLNGGLNSTAGALAVKDNESSDLQNVDFDKFGAVQQRLGYETLHSASLNGGATCELLEWFEYTKAAAKVRQAVNVSGDGIYKMDDLDGTWDDITSGISITANSVADSTTWLNQIHMTNDVDVPFKWQPVDHTGASVSIVVTGLTKAKAVEQYNNYLFYANVLVSGVRHPSRIYWSALKDARTWNAADYIDVAKDDGQAIVALKVLGDRLVVYKERSIYNVFFTGDSDIPFILPGGGKSNSAVGCAAQFSIQEVENGHVFLSQDGLYFYDGNNTFKISDRITDTILGYNTQLFSEARSLVQKGKNRYWLSMTDDGDSTNSVVIIWDYFNNAFSIYTGMAPSNMTTFWVAGTEERPYWADYSGYTYRSDTGDNDNPLGVETKIESYYYTNWRHYGDLIDKKGVAHVTIYHTIEDSTLTFAYSYEFDEDDQYSNLFSMASSGAKWDSFVWDVDSWAKTGGNIQRIDLDGRGRVMRYKFENLNVDETWRVEGFGALPHLETLQ